MAQIKNKTQLIEKNDPFPLKKARTLAIGSLERALKAIEPKNLMHSKLTLKGSFLNASDFTFDLKKFQHIYVLGGGKAGELMAEGLEEILGALVTEGLVNVPYRSKHTTRIVELHEASHPVPDEAGVEGTRRMMAIAGKAEKGDLLICLMSGGGSSLMPLPRKGISLGDEQELTNSLLKSGATITEINSVRKHLSAFKGGWLAKAAYPATVLNLILSDVVGDPLDSIASGPTVADPSTFQDAVNVLKKYDLWLNAPDSVKALLSDGVKGLIEETPKANDEAFQKVFNVVLGNTRTACLAALQYLEAEGLNATLLSTTVEGEARHVGTVLSALAHEIIDSGNPVGKPAALIIGGETTVTVKGKGAGGRNQELALSAAMKLQDLKGTVVIASLSTDGIDGPTDAAGAIVDGYTIPRASQLGLDAEEFLANNDSYKFFSKLGDLIHTDPTGTNVNDISLAIIL